MYLKLVLFNSSGDAGGGPTDFVFVMRTTVDNETITLPATGTNNFEIDWGDGTVETITTVSPTHEYATADDYTITISGQCSRWYFNNTAEAVKLIAVNNLGVVGWEQLADGFAGCSNVVNFVCGNTDTSNVSDMSYMMVGLINTANTPNLTGLSTENNTSMTYMMRGWYSVTESPDVSGFDTSKTTSFSSTFHSMGLWSLIKLDIAIDQWDIGLCRTMANMLYQSTLTTECYDRTLIAWAAQNVQPDVVAHFGNSKYTAGGAAEAARDTLTNEPNRWSITDAGGISYPFEFVMRTTTDNETITLPATGTNNFEIDWGDGNVETITTVSPTHEYATAGDHTITIVGICHEWYFGNSGDKDKLIKVNNLGVVGWELLAGAFHGCANIETFITGNTDISNVTSLSTAFYSWTSMTSPPDLSGLDTSNVTNMAYMMRYWSSMTSPPDLSNFNTSEVTSMYLMMDSWASMTSPPDLSSFDTSKVLDMRSMMQNWSAMGEIDIPIDTWNIEACTSMTNMLLATTLTTECYDRVLISWAAQNVQPDVVAHFGNSKYTAGSAAETARDVLTNEPNRWSITDAGPDFSSGWQLTFDGTDYAELSEPVTFAGDFEFEIEFSTLIETNQIFMGDDHTSTYYFNMAPNSDLVLVSIAGQLVTWDTTGYTLNDGNVHKVLYKLVGATAELFIDGVSLGIKSGITQYTGVNNFLIGTANSITTKFVGTIHSVTLTDITTPANSVSWELNSGPPVYDVGDDIVRNGSFDSEDDWVLTGSAGSSSTIANGQLTISRVGTDLAYARQDNLYTVGETYAIEVDVESIQGNGFNIWYGGSQNTSDNIRSSGIHTVIGVPDGKQLYIYAGGTGAGAVINSITVKPLNSVISDGTILEPSEEYGWNGDVMRPDEWTIPTSDGITTSGRAISFDGTQNNYSSSSANQLEKYNGLYYIATIGSGITQGGGRIVVDNTSNLNVVPTTISENGFYTYYQLPIDAAIIGYGLNDALIGTLEVGQINPVPKGLIYHNVEASDWSEG